MLKFTIILFPYLIMLFKLRHCSNHSVVWDKKQLCIIYHCLITLNPAKEIKSRNYQCEVTCNLNRNMLVWIFISREPQEMDLPDYLKNECCIWKRRVIFKRNNFQQRELQDQVRLKTLNSSYCSKVDKKLFTLTSRIIKQCTREFIIIK